MLIILGLIITVLFGYLGSLPAILYRKHKKANFSWAEKICFFFLGCVIYILLCYLINPNGHYSHPPVIGGAVIYYFVMIDYESKKKNTDEENKQN